ncbi:MAG: spore coat protein [Clostridiaceae bacterium]|jgi:spore coat protein CotF|nr:spore coat protein [Bacillota bacterium]NLI39412.1 spore coat protein [Clostridiaceae bacterium]
MMTEKDMVNDYLSSLKSSLTGYASAISESSNPELRKTFQQMRDADEQRQQKLAQFAIQKGYYQPAAQAQQSQIQQVYSQLQGGGQQQQQGMQQGMQNNQGMRM